MLDIKLVREEPEAVVKDLKKRKSEDKLKILRDIIKKDEEWRQIKTLEDSVRKRRNELSKNINQHKKQGKPIQNLLDEAKKIPSKLKNLEEKRKKLEENTKTLLCQMPNLTHESVPYGKSNEDNQEIKKWGKPTKKGFSQPPHSETIENLGIADFERSAKISGSGFYFLKGDLALLNQALIRLSIDQMIKKGYIYTEPPLLMNKDAYQTGVSLEDFEDVMYKIQDEEVYLIATSEHPLLAQFKDDTFKEEELPIKIVGYSMCFRREIGSHGIDTKGLFRTHQFNKTEQIIICKPEDSWKYHEELQKNAEELQQLLELPYRVVNVCTGDLGSFAAKKYDIETWMTRQQEYKETGSNSNYTDYQARRANIRYHVKKDNSYRYAHTLNSTAIATSRILVAIIERYTNKDGTITIPKALRPYMYGKETITKIHL